MVKSVFTLLIIILLLAEVSSANQLLLPDDPRQSISYWKDQAVLESDDSDVALANRVFAQLLRAWDGSSIEPALYVIKGQNGAWAASLADGHILLSREALKISLFEGRDRGEHLLAFILAHELSHQRADDLWHLRFFRDVRKLQRLDQDRILQGWNLSQDVINDLEEKEAQADRNGLVMMASVGFNPWLVIQGDGFFQQWVENIWQLPCSNNDHLQLRALCDKADRRHRRTRLQLDAIASQSTLYDLGVQFSVAGDYARARYYFTLYAREFPGRPVLSAIAMSYLNEAVALSNAISELSISEADFYYPLILQSQILPQQSLNDSSKRAAEDVEINRLKQQKRKKALLAIPYLEKVIRLDPDYKPAYINLAMAHLLEANTFRVRGVLQGQYLPEFGRDNMVDQLLALTQALEGDPQSAIYLLENLMKRGGPSSIIEPQLFEYSLAYNLSALYRLQNRQGDAEEVWKKLAVRAQESGQSYLFRLALAQFKAEQPRLSFSPGAPLIRGLQLDDRKPRDSTPHRLSELWIEGERFQVSIYEDGVKLVTAMNGRVISASQNGGPALDSININVGDRSDRPLKVLGIPSRRVSFGSGEYLAYDQMGLAVRLDNDQVKGWMLYQPGSSGD